MSTTISVLTAIADSPVFADFGLELVIALLRNTYAEVWELVAVAALMPLLRLLKMGKCMCSVRNNGVVVKAAMCVHHADVSHSFRANSRGEIWISKEEIGHRTDFFGDNGEYLGSLGNLRTGVIHVGELRNN